MDLVTPTPLTYTDTRSVYNCSWITAVDNLDATPTYYTQYYTATVSGEPYPAQNSIVLTEIITSTTYLYFPVTFPGLTVTQLSPGEAITLVNLLHGVRFY